MNEYEIYKLRNELNELRKYVQSMEILASNARAICIELDEKLHDAEMKEANKFLEGVI